jgi:hypothetical protein
MNQIELPALPYEKLLSPKQVAAEFGVDEDTMLRWWHEGLPTGREIPRAYMRRRGFWGYLFYPQVVEFIRAEQATLD